MFNNFKLKKCSGVVELSDWSFGAVRLGQQIVGIIDCKTEKGIWCMEGGGSELDQRVESFATQMAI